MFRTLFRRASEAVSRGTPAGFIAGMKVGAIGSAMTVATSIPIHHLAFSNNYNAQAQADADTKHLSTATKTNSIHLFLHLDPTKHNANHVISVNYFTAICIVLGTASGYKLARVIARSSRA